MRISALLRISALFSGGVGWRHSCSVRGQTAAAYGKPTSVAVGYPVLNVLDEGVREALDGTGPTKMALCFGHFTTLFRSFYDSLNEYGLLNSPNKADGFRNFYLSFDWSETCDHELLEVFVKNVILRAATQS